MLNYKEINRALNKYPLCYGKLIGHVGMIQGYCAMGALAKDCGVTDQQLQAFPADGADLFNHIRLQLNEKFGIETLDQFQNLMCTNDGSKNHERNRKVDSTAKLMAVDEIVRMIEKSKLTSAEPTGKNEEETKKWLESRETARVNKSE